MATASMPGPRAVLQAFRNAPGLIRRARVPRDVGPLTTVRTDDEVDPTSVGMAADAIERVWTAVEKVYRTGVHPAIAVCLRRDGQVVMHRSIGHARGHGPNAAPGEDPVVVSPDDPFVIASASKAITAMVIHLLDERNLLHVDDRVCEYIPEFAANGKQDITLAHVLAHRSGMPTLSADALDLDMLGDLDHVLRHLTEARPLHPPGRFMAYHAVSGGFILGEVVRRVTGRPIQEVFEQEVAGPLGTTWLGYGTTPDRVGQVVIDHYTGLPVLPPLSTALRRALGAPFGECVDIMNDPRFRTGVVPAANVICTAEELSRFYELLRRGGTYDGVTVFQPRTIRRAVSEQSYMEVDLTLGFPFRYGMGFMLGAKVLSLYGPNTHHAFGHLGFTNVIGWADPERRVAGAILTSGKPVVGAHLVPLYEVMRTIASVAPRDGLVDDGREWA